VTSFRFDVIRQVFLKESAFPVPLFPPHEAARFGFDKRDCHLQRLRLNNNIVI